MLVLRPFVEQLVATPCSEGFTNQRLKHTKEGELTKRQYSLSHCNQGINPFQAINLLDANLSLALGVDYAPVRQI